MTQPQPRPAGRFTQSVISVIILLAFTGCAAPAPTAASTAMPAPAASATAAPTDTPAPSDTLTPTPSVTAAPTETLAPTASTAPTATVTSTFPPLVPFSWKGSKRPLLMAHYMPWYQTKDVDGVWGWHWTMNHFSPSQAGDGTWTGLASHFTPLTGPYSSNDEAVLEYQAMLMKLSGIDGVIVDWYGSDDALDYGGINTATQTLFKVIKRAGLKFAICYEDQTIQHLIDNGNFTADQAVTRGQAVMAYLQKTWFTDPAYLKVNGKPLLITFGPTYFTGPDQWTALFSVLNPKPLFITLDNHSVPEAPASFPWPPMWASVGGVLTSDAAKSYLDDFYSGAQTLKWPYVLGGAFPGFYDIYKEAGVGNSYGFLDAQQDRTFRMTLQTALDHKPDMIQLITWNDYGEGTIIEPTVEFGNRYLEVVQEVNRLTSGASFTYTAADLTLPLAWYKLRVKNSADPAVMAKLDQAFKSVAAGNMKAAREIIKGLGQ